MHYQYYEVRILIQTGWDKLYLNWTLSTSHQRTIHLQVLRVSASPQNYDSLKTMKETRGIHLLQACIDYGREMNHYVDVRCSRCALQEASSPIQGSTYKLRLGQP